MIGQDPTFVEAGLPGPNYRQWSRDIVIEIENPVAELSLSAVGFSQARWAKFLTEYFDPGTIKHFLGFLVGRKLIDAQEYAFICSSHARHSLGNCLFGLTVRTGHNPRVNLVSRSCNLVPTGILDISFGAAMSQAVAYITQKERATLVWNIAHLQINSWPALLFLINLDLDPESILNPKIPFQKNMLEVYRMCQIGKLPNDKYMFYQRYMKKINEANQRRKEGQKNYPVIPYLPYAWTPWEPEFLEVDPADAQSPYNPVGASVTLEEIYEYRS